jgi:hypothetical protein
MAVIPAVTVDPFASATTPVEGVLACAPVGVLDGDDEDSEGLGVGVPVARRCTPAVAGAAGAAVERDSVALDD